MKFKIRTIKQVTIIVSSISSALDVIITILHGTPWWTWPLTAVSAFFVTYYLFKFFLNQYVIFRIKPLYQLLLSKDIITSKLSEELRKKMNEDIVDDIQENINHLVEFSSDELERLEQQKKIHSEFLISMFHEIKTPVAIMKGYTQTLLERKFDNMNTVKRYLERNIATIERLALIIKDMEIITSYESGMEIVRKERFDIIELADEVLKEKKQAALEKNITLEISTVAFPPKAPIIVYGDREKVKLVLTNLIQNSIKYSPLESKVIISFIDMFDKILTEVTDKGIGIPANDIPYVFDVFYRVEKNRTRERGGPGLGLSIVKRIIDAHGENITVRSKVEEGTTFSFTLTK